MACNKRKISSSDHISFICSSRQQLMEFALNTTEHMFAIFFDNNKKVISSKDIVSGESTSVVFDMTKLLNIYNKSDSSYVLFGHNHPHSKTAMPSNADSSNHYMWVSFCKNNNITIVDEVIVAGTTVYSFRRRTTFDIAHYIKEVT